MDRLNRRRAKQSGSAEVRIKFAMLSSQYKVAMEWATSTYTRNIGVRASICNRHIDNKMAVRSSRSPTKPHPHGDLEKLLTEYGGPPTASPAP
jgi:hypothetical protein